MYKYCDYLLQLVNDLKNVCCCCFSHHLQEEGRFQIWLLLKWSIYSLSLHFTFCGIQKVCCSSWFYAILGHNSVNSSHIWIFFPLACFYIDSEGSFIVYAFNITQQRITMAVTATTTTAVVFYGARILKDQGPAVTLKNLLHDNR